MYSVGVILLRILDRMLPLELHGDYQDSKKQVIEEGESDFIDQVKRCTETNPFLRPEIKELLDHPWIKGSSDRTDLIVEDILKFIEDTKDILAE